MNVVDIHHKQVPGSQCFFTQATVLNRTCWLVCEVVSVLEPLLPCQCQIVFLCVFFLKWPLFPTLSQPLHSCVYLACLPGSVSLGCASMIIVLLLMVAIGVPGWEINFFKPFIHYHTVTGTSALVSAHSVSVSGNLMRVL